MSKINTFLQKRKMHESRYGIIMVIIAYVLSIFMLFLGSDVFYNIKSKAAGIKNETDEATQETLEEGELDREMADLRAQKLQAKYMNAKSLYADGGFSASILSSNKEQPDRDSRGDTKETKKQNSNDNTKTLLAEAEGTDSAKKDTKSAAKSTAKKKDASIKSLSVKTETAADSKAATSDKAKDGKAKEAKKAKKAEEAKEASGEYVYDATDKEVEMLERIVQAEAGSEDMKGRILVANVVLNRVSNKNFPDTVKQVIFQNSDGEYQFSPVADKRYWSVKVSKKTKEAVQRALQGEDYSDGALYFMARKRAKASNAKWFDDNLKWLFKHGGHEFYR